MTQAVDEPRSLPSLVRNVRSYGTGVLRARNISRHSIDGVKALLTLTVTQHSGSPHFQTL